METLKKHIVFPFLFAFSLYSCGTQKELVDLLNEVDITPQNVMIENSFSVNNEEGHIQGVQFFKYKKRDYFFLTGSSNNQSYFAVVDANQKKTISINKILDEPYRHPGGFQIAEKLLAVGVEDNLKTDKSKVLLFKIVDPKKPELKLLKTIDRSGAPKRYTAGCVALTKQNKKILVAVGNWDTKNIEFYSISSKRLSDPSSNFEIVCSIDSEKFNRENWIEKTWFSYQNINFIKGTKKRLYLVGTAFDQTSEMEIVDIFEVTSSNPENFELQKVGHRKFKQSNLTTLGWGGGIYLNKKEGIKIFSSGEQITDSLHLSLYLNER